MLGHNACHHGKNALLVFGDDEDARLVGLFLHAVPVHGNKALRLHVGHIGAVRPMHADAEAPADIADDGIAGHRVAALGEAHQHPVHARYAHAFRFARGGVLAFLDSGRRWFRNKWFLRMQHGVKTVEHLARRGVRIPHRSHQIVHALKIHFLGHKRQLPGLGGLAHIKVDLAAFFLQQITAQSHCVGAFLRAQIMLDAAAGLGGLDNLEPVPIGIARRVGKNFDHIAVFQLRAQRHEPPVDFCSGTVLPNLTVDNKGEIKRRGPFGQFLDIARRGVDVNLVLEQIHFQRMHELA